MAAMSADGSMGLRPADALATVEERAGRRIVRLPAPFARDAVETFLRWHRVRAEVLDRPGESLGGSAVLGADEWALAVPIEECPRLMVLLEIDSPGRILVRGERQLCNLFVLPRHTLPVPARCVRQVLAALEHSKPPALDANGLPLPWVPPRPPTAALGGREHPEDEVHVVAAGEALPALDAAPGAEPPDAIRAAVDEAVSRLRARLGLPPFEVVVRPGTFDRRGFTPGRVWYGDDHAPRRVLLTPCPNADPAEVLATLVHEVAHPVARTRAHGLAFKRTLVDLAGDLWGASYFEEAARRVGERHEVVDCWVATGIRAALSGDPPPAARTSDDGQTARIVSRIGKLRALAASQPGEPEAVAATARANDLVTIYGLAGYQVRVDAGIDDQMVDRWVQLDRRKVWQRVLAHAVARFCGVFSLSMAGEARMHFFGAWRDVVAAEYLYEVAAASIERQVEAHLARWKQARRRRPGETRRERTSFCDCAVHAFAEKLRRIRDDERRRAEAAPASPDARAWHLTTRALDRARDFAREEHEKRGLSWGAGTSKAVTYNPDGIRAGRAIQVTLGLTADGHAPRALPGPRR